MGSLYGGHDRCDAAYSARLPSALDQRIRAAATAEGLSTNEMRVMCLRHGADTYDVVSRDSEWIRAALRSYAVDLPGLVVMMLERGQQVLALEMKDREARLAKLHEPDRKRR